MVETESSDSSENDSLEIEQDSGKSDTASYIASEPSLWHVRWMVLAGCGIAAFLGLAVEGLADMEIPGVSLVIGIALAAPQLTGVWAGLGSGSYLRRSFASLLVHSLWLCVFMATFMFAIESGSTEYLLHFGVDVVAGWTLMWLAANIPCLMLRFSGWFIGPWREGIETTRITISDLFVLTFYIALVIAIGKQARSFDVVLPVTISSLIAFTFGTATGLCLLLKPRKRGHLPAEDDAAGCLIYAVGALTVPVLVMALLVAPFGGVGSGEPIVAMMTISCVFAAILGGCLWLHREAGYVLYTRKRLRRWTEESPGPYRFPPVAGNEPLSKSEPFLGKDGSDPESSATGQTGGD